MKDVAVPVLIFFFTYIVGGAIFEAVVEAVFGVPKHSRLLDIAQLLAAFGIAALYYEKVKKNRSDS